nr:MAG TPA: Hepatitis C virus non-structural protein NS2 [Caudoviricetes sp.]
MKGGEAHDRCIFHRKEGVHHGNAQQYECGGWLNGKEVRCRPH